MKKFFSSLVLAVALSSCAGVTANRPDQVVYAAQGAYNSALAIALEYKALPRCPASTAICSDASVVKKLQDADNQAYDALVKAQAVVRTSNIGGYADAIAASAAKAVDFFKSLTSGLRTK